WLPRWLSTFSLMVRNFVVQEFRRIYFISHLFLFLYQALFIHFSLAGVIFKRESWPKEHKPQVWSGPNLCYDKDGNNKFPIPKDPPWFTDDMCHLSACLGLMVLTKSMCFTKGTSCGEGEYLAAVPAPPSPTACCVCKPCKSRV
ncbi:unnamed protein product, partial [Pocillopora meandrina]